MTKQEFYDRLVKASHDGTFPSGRVDENGEYFCEYVHIDGQGREHRCAAGILLPPGHVNLPSKRVESLETVFRPLLPERLSISDLEQVQQAHDCIARAMYHNGRLKTQWNADTFVARINALPCFANVNKVAPKEVST